jgi:hypothetical protein
MSGDQRAEDYQDALRDIVDCLGGAGFDYMVVGSVALAAHAEPRFTRDIDIVIDIATREVPKLVVALEKDFDVQREMVEDEVARQGMFNVFHRATVFKVDLVVLMRDRLSQEQFARRIPVMDERGRPVFMQTPEDVVVSNLNWAKESHSEFQLRDVRAMLRRPGTSIACT